MQTCCLKKTKYSLLKKTKLGHLIHCKYSPAMSLRVFLWEILSRINFSQILHTIRTLSFILSVCSVPYKVISQALMNRRKVMQSQISILLTAGRSLS